MYVTQPPAAAAPSSTWPTYDLDAQELAGDVQCPKRPQSTQQLSIVMRVSF
jgi:hypothetical protein